MFIRCPACQTLFRIQPKQLKAARGQVRCGSCQAVFDGLEFLVNREELKREELAALTRQHEAASRQWQLPFDDLAPAPEPVAPMEATQPPGTSAHSEEIATPATSGSEAVIPPAARAADATVKAEAEETAVPVTVTPLDELAPATPVVEPEVAPAESEPALPFKWSPRYALSSHQPETAPPLRLASRIGWGIGSLLLIALLAAQWAWFNRNTLPLDPQWRPWLQRACATVGCELPPLRDPHAIEMIDRNVQSHPQYQGALLITATLVNQAPFAQPYPLVELAMTDLDQRRVATRRFLPGEYLDNGAPQGLLQPGASVRLKLEIADPGQEAVGFEFNFF